MVISLRGNELFRFSTCSSVAYRYSLYVILLYQLLQFTGSRHLLRFRRMRVNGFVMQQRTLSVEADYLTSGTESWVYTKHTLLSQWRSQQQLAQVLGEHTYSLLIGLLLARCREFSLYGRLKQTLVGIGYGCRHLILAFPSATH